MLLSFAQNHFNCFLTTWEFRVPLSISVNVHPFFLQRQHEFQSSPRFHIQVVLLSSCTLPPFPPSFVSLSAGVSLSILRL